MSAPAIAVVGFSNSGKTSLIERLIPLMRAAGFRVSTIKHHHGSLDQEGKDSWRHRRAGAEATVLVGRDGIMINSGDDSPLERLHRALTLVDGDLILVEGLKESPLPKIAVFRTPLELAQLGERGNLIGAVRSPNYMGPDGNGLPSDLAVPVFEWDQIQGLAETAAEYVRAARR